MKSRRKLTIEQDDEILNEFSDPINSDMDVESPLKRHSRRSSGHTNLLSGISSGSTPSSRRTTTGTVPDDDYENEPMDYDDDGPDNQSQTSFGNLNASPSPTPEEEDEVAEPAPVSTKPVSKGKDKRQLLGIIPEEEAEEQDEAEMQDVDMDVDEQDDERPTKRSKVLSIPSCTLPASHLIARQKLPRNLPAQPPRRSERKKIAQVLAQIQSNPSSRRCPSEV